MEEVEDETERSASLSVAVWLIKTEWAEQEEELYELKIGKRKCLSEFVSERQRYKVREKEREYFKKFCVA
jgi:hypothetical protein